MAKKILIIEADPTALRLTEYTLKQRGYQVITTSNGLEGIITAQKEAPDLIILDVMLPGVDGYEVCKRLRAGFQTAEIPILIISGKTREEDIAIGFKAGANDYLPKPATPSTIISRVERLLLVKPDGKLGIIAFINTGEIPGMTVLLSEIAAAVTEMEKQVTLVEVVTGQKKDAKNKTPRKTRPAPFWKPPAITRKKRSRPAKSCRPGYEYYILPKALKKAMTPSVMAWKCCRA